MEFSSEVVFALIGDMYEAAASPLHWKVVLDRLCAFSRSSKAYFLFSDPSGQCDLSLQTGWDTSFQEIYAREWFDHDIVLSSYVAAQKRSGGDWIGDRQSVLTNRDFFRSTIYNDLIRPQGDHHLVAAALGAMPNGLQGGLALRRAIGTPAYEAEFITLLAILAPHMKRALSLHKQISALRQERAAFASSVEAFDIPVISIDAVGKVRSMSLTAQSLLQAGLGLKLCGGTLTAAHPEENSQLQALIRGSVRTSTGNADPILVRQSRAYTAGTTAQADFTPAFGGAMRISRGVALPAIQVSIWPFRSSMSLLDDRPAALVFLADPNAKQRSRSAILQTLFRLAPTEARIVDFLLTGQSIKEAATQLHLTEGTVRFHVKEVFQKIGVHSQSALLRFVMALPPS